MAYVKPFELHDLAPIAKNLREDDKREIEAAIGIAPEAALLMSITSADYCNVIMTDKPVGIFGLEGKATLGQPWMLATDGIKDCQIQFLKECRNFIDEMLTYYPILSNFVDERNTLHQKWLSWCGFIPFKRIEGYGIAQIPFIEYVRI